MKFFIFLTALVRKLGVPMHIMLQALIDELNSSADWPEYYQERLAKRIWPIITEVETDMVMSDYYAKKRSAEGIVTEGGNNVPSSEAR
jgi:hypothetical protein